MILRKMMMMSQIHIKRKNLKEEKKLIRVKKMIMKVMKENIE